jgi:preprotein translocase subunit SecB
MPNQNNVEKKSGQEAPHTGPEFAIQRIYVTGLSVETPNSPQIFLDQWDPEVKLDIETKASSLDKNTHEVVLTVTVTVKIKDKTAFLVEVQQAGIFSLVNFPEDQLHPMLGSFCPNILYPYAREAVTDAVVRAGFPQLYLTPVNFDALYEQHKREKKEGSPQNTDDSKAVH